VSGRTIRDLSTLVRSKNAGPFCITFDIMFRERGDYEAAKHLAALTAPELAERFRVPAETISVFFFDPSAAVKITMPREHPAGSVWDQDLYGAQQHVPLLDIEVPT